MVTMTYSEARAKLAKAMSQVCRDHAPVTITRRSKDTVVMMSLADYESLCETSYLLRSPKNARRLLEGIDQLARGKGKERKLAE